jgi:hypothetical protein
MTKCWAKADATAVACRSMRARIELGRDQATDHSVSLQLEAALHRDIEGLHVRFHALLVSAHQRIDHLQIVLVRAIEAD